VIDPFKAPDERLEAVRFEEERLVVDLRDGRTLSVPIAWYPRLARGTPAERQNWEEIGDGFGIHWPDLDEDLSVRGLLRGIPAPELRQARAGPAPTDGAPTDGQPTARSSGRWDTAEYLNSTDAILAYLEAAFEDGEPELVALALNNVARARGLSEDALTPASDIAAVIRTLKALGLELTAKAA